MCVGGGGGSFTRKTLVCASSETLASLCALESLLYSAPIFIIVRDQSLFYTYYMYCKNTKTEYL